MSKFERWLILLLIVYVVLQGIFVFKIRELGQAFRDYEGALRGQSERPVKMEVIYKKAED